MTALKRKVTAAAAAIIATLPVWVVCTQLATPKASPESTTKIVPIMKSTFETVISRFTVLTSDDEAVGACAVLFVIDEALLVF